MSYKTNLSVGLSFIAVSIILAFIVSPESKFLLYLAYMIFSIGASFTLAILSGNMKINMPTVRASGSVAIFVFLIIFNPIEKLDAAQDREDLTIFVHGPKGYYDLVLKDKGSVIYESGSEKKQEKINDKGQVVFHDVHFGGSARLSILCDEPYQAVSPDSIYRIHTANIHLEVRLGGIDTVSGVVIYNQMPVKGAIVEVASIKDTTDQLGEFSFKIPENLQRRTYELSCYKAGFQLERQTIYPQTLEKISVVLNKAR